MRARRILYVQYANPAAYPPLEHSAQLLAQRGWKVLFAGSGSDGTGAFRFDPCPGVEVRMFGFCPPGLRQKLHYAGFLIWVLWTAWRWKASWIYASDPFSCPCALVVSAFFRLPVLYHEHDAPGGARFQSEATPFMRRVLAARKRLAVLARACVLPNHGRAERFFSETGAPNVLSVWNCPVSAEVGPARPKRSEAGLKVLYQGSIVPDRLPPAVIEALAKLPEGATLTLFGYETIGHPGYKAKLASLARELQVEHRIEFKPVLRTRAEVLQEASRHDVGLSLILPAQDDPNLEHMEGASNKTFDYLARGVAVLVPDLPGWNKLFVEPGFGLACDPADAGSLAAALRRMLEQPEETWRMGEAGRQRILAEWNYEKQFDPVLKLLES